MASEGYLLPLSMASMSASVSLCLMQSMSCLCDRSPALSMRRRPGMREHTPPMPDLGSLSRPSNSSTSRRSARRMVSSTHRSSPCCSADSMADGRDERRRVWVTSGEPRHSVANRLMTVLTLLEDAPAAPAGLGVPSATGGGALEVPPAPGPAAAGGGSVMEVLEGSLPPPAWERRCSRSSTSPC
jgi:hypothetical protein